MTHFYAGDRLVRPKQDAKMIKHHVIYVGVVNGTHQIVENQINEGVKLTPLIEFQEKHSDYTIIRFEGSQDERNRIVKDSLDRLGTPYKLLSYNCETFANDVQFKKRVSYQIIGWGIGLVAFFGAVFAIRQNSKSRN